MDQPSTSAQSIGPSSILSGDHQTKVATEPKVQPKDSTTTASPTNINYRTLVKRSRYAQIEAELDKLKSRLASIEEQGGGGGRFHSVATETSAYDTNEDHRPVALKDHIILDDADKEKLSRTKLSQTLVNIEDDLHRILFVLLRQYELFNQRFQSKNVTTTPANILPPTIEAEMKSVQIQTDLNTPKKKESSSVRQPILGADLRVESQSNLSVTVRTESAKSTAHPSQADIRHDSLIGVSKPLHEFRSKSSDRPKSNIRSTSTAKPSRHEPLKIYHCHYHITRPDVHWILGTV